MNTEELKEKIENLEKELNKIKSELAEEDKYFDLSRLTKAGTTIFISSLSKEAGFEDNLFFQIRGDGEFEGKAFYLSKWYNWEMKEDSKGFLVLIPTKK